MKGTEDEVVILNDMEIPFINAEFGRGQDLVGKSSKAKSEKITLKLIEYQPGFISSTHTHPDQEEIIYVLAGRGITEWSTGKRSIGPGDVVFIPSDKEHVTYNPYTEPLRVLIIKAPQD